MMSGWLKGALALQNLWLAMVQECLLVTFVFAIVWLLCKLPWVTSPHLRMGLWHLVWLRFFLPVDFGWNLGLHNWTRPLQQTLLPLTSAPFFEGTDALEVPASASPFAPGVAVFLWVSIFLYAAMVLLLLGRFYRRRYHIHRLLSFAQPVSDAVASNYLNTWCARFKIRRKVRLVTAHLGCAPFTLGWRKPIVFIPQRLLVHSRDALDSVIGHEVAHIKRFDDIWLQVLHFARAFFFFHPVAHACFRACELERERLCDALVLRHGSGDAIAYGRSLLKVTRLFAADMGAVPGISPAAHQLAIRIRSLSAYVRSGIHPWRTALVLVFFAWLLLPLAGAQTGFSRKGAGQKTWIHPLPLSRPTSGFGDRRNPFSGEKAFHKGIDLPAPQGTEVLAPAGALVQEATVSYKDGEAYGTVVVLDHGDGWVTLFSHLDRLSVEKGQRVNQGQVVAWVGMTGKTTAPHLHFEMWKDGAPVDPQLFLPETKPDRE